MNMVGSGITALGVFALVSSGALACPDLSGTYECPARPGQPPMTMIVTMKSDAGETATYAFTYISGDTKTSLQAVAGPKGIVGADGVTSSCNGATFMRRDATEQGEGTRNFINSAGNFESVYGGRTQILCIRKPG
jgi:hypothetical protein